MEVHTKKVEKKKKVHCSSPKLFKHMIEILEKENPENLETNRVLPVIGNLESSEINCY